MLLENAYNYEDLKRTMPRLLELRPSKMPLGISNSLLAKDSKTGQQIRSQPPSPSPSHFHLLSDSTMHHPCSNHGSEAPLPLDKVSSYITAAPLSQLSS
ncbi:hypothetical protein AVEN_7724-1 [Araneus ventricosus]|uniref:Uncharacterized protein n=1 Tax=Araneus ventricosus TaxID=182803 RepID=A0A4Y2SEQ9_ARAVE|nr:hypothetical protein AVEN_7724-1 [Araneus ventricosus]